jgi:hypothetical protein
MLVDVQLLVRAASALLALAPAPQEGLLVAHGGGEIDYALAPGENCVTAKERAEIDRRVQAWLELHPPAAAQAAPAVPLYSFFPMGGRPYRDLITLTFNDLDPSAGLLDWSCGLLTYNGHDASDTIIRSFAEQAIGVPIFAVLPGTVIAAHDGEPDMNLTCTGTANYVTIDHGGGRVCSYLHMKKNSVAVASGQHVAAGQQIGLVGSSGCSKYPHLHFASTQNGAKLEPYSGPCNPGPSAWSNQTPLDFSVYMDEFALSETSPVGIVPPAVLPRSSHWAQTNDTLWVWCYLKNMGPGNTWQLRFERPDGSIAKTTAVTPFNATSFLRWSWWWWGYDIPSMKTTPGTWHVELSINGKVEIDAPLEVVPTPIPGFNRAPEPIAVSFVPACPKPSDVLVCQIDTSLVLDDVDWDILAYRYLWKVDGAVARDVTSAGHADALPQFSWSPGETVTCEVTPTDGQLLGPTATASFTSVSSYCTPGTTASGCTAQISALGATSLSAPAGFDVTVSGAEGAKDGLLFFSTHGQQAVPWGNGTSFQCVVPPVVRTGLQSGTGTAGACNGSFQLDFNTWMAAHPAQSPAAGEQVSMQCWFRDPASTSNQSTSLSDALGFAVCP